MKYLSVALFILSLSALLHAEEGYQQNHQEHKHHQHHQTPTSVNISIEKPMGPHAYHYMHRAMTNAEMIPEPSGTSWQPQSSPMEGIHLNKKDWLFMLHGFANLGYTGRSKARESSRGAFGFFTTNMLMGMASRPLGRGSIAFRAMADFEPIMGPEGYPLLLQAGGSEDGNSHLVDRQHPHDMIMELATVYSHEFADRQSAFLYLGLPGEPALGPPAFMHRFSSINNPVAPITHHWFDRTHITMGVATLGYVWRTWKWEGSVFKGREPDERRYDIERPEFDSVSGRLSFNPTDNLAIQGSYGHLVNPEPAIDTMDRFNVTAIFNWMPQDEAWQFMAGWGLNRKRPGADTHALLFELTRAIRQTHTFFYRAEVAGKDDLYLDGGPSHIHRPGPNGIAMLSPSAGEIKTVYKFAGGYIYDIAKLKKTSWGVGATVAIHMLPVALEAAYGSPVLTGTIFTRVRLFE